MDPLLIVSPHLDDAVLSVGQIMAGRPDTVVATVFAGIPPASQPLTDYDRLCRFHESPRAMHARRREDLAAVAGLNATARHLDHLDHQYRQSGTIPTAERVQIVDEILEALDDTGATVALGPVGLLHADHLIVAEAYRDALWARRDTVEGWIYEELPSRVLEPLEVTGALDVWRGGATLELSFLGTGPRHLKEQAIRQYASQLAALDWPPLLCPERVWRVHWWT